MYKVKFTHGATSYRTILPIIPPVGSIINLGDNVVDRGDYEVCDLPMYIHPVYVGDSDTNFEWEFVLPVEPLGGGK